ncbi:MAG TPA: hypothetical protein VKV26_23595, partial [Dehalococcoidia bacterium]|nr:hypothetical protein [Dehalococcoidia bacterium]
MLGLGLASSHAPGMWRPPSEWTHFLERMPDEIRNSLPQTARQEIASLELRQDYYRRMHAAFATLREQVQTYRPDALILIGDDQGDLNALKHLFTFDSDSLRSGTGEVRAWISVAAAMARPAKVVEYVPAHCTFTGCGFVYWPCAGNREQGIEGVAGRG